MQNKPLVSIITPCHNSESFIFRLLDSVLSQTYPYVEMFAIDNDSKDGTAAIINSYIPRFEERGYKLTYIHQDDLGPSSAIQTGLKYISGDYLLMPDSDDYYNTDYAIEKWVETFLSLPNNYAIVRCQLQFIDEAGLKPIGIIYEHAAEDGPDTLFDDCLFGKNGYSFAPINYMVKISALKELTNLQIFNAYNFGQQRQICLPLYYKYKAWTILEPLACYLVRKKSISHGDYSKYPVQKTLYHKQEEYIDAIFSCVKSMPDIIKQQYRNRFLKMQVENIVMNALESKAQIDIPGYRSDYLRYGGNLFRFRICILKCRCRLIKRNIGSILRHSNRK